MLMAEAEKRLQLLGCPKVNLQVRGSNHAALDFYRRIGYTVDDSVSLGRRLVDDCRSVANLLATKTFGNAWTKSNPGWERGGYGHLGPPFLAGVHG